jgi:hypothetical protein
MKLLAIISIAFDLVYRSIHDNFNLKVIIIIIKNNISVLKIKFISLLNKINNFLQTKHLNTNHILIPTS